MTRLPSIIGPGKDMQPKNRLPEATSLDTGIMSSDIAEGFNQGALTPGGSVQVEICTALWLKA